MKQDIVAFERFDACVEWAWKTYMAEHPIDYKLDMEFIAKLRGQGGRDEQWFRDKTAYHSAEIPRFVSNHINFYFPGWLHDKKYRDRFLKTSPECRMSNEKFIGTKGGNQSVEENIQERNEFFRNE